MVSGFVVLLLAVGCFCVPQDGIVATQKMTNFSAEGNDTTFVDEVLEKLENFTVKNELNSSFHENVSNTGDNKKMLSDGGDDGYGDNHTTTSKVFSTKKLSFVVRVTSSNGTTTRTSTRSDRHDREDSKTIRNKVKVAIASRHHTRVVNESIKPTDDDDIDHLSTNGSMPLNDGRNVMNNSGYEKQESSKENEVTEQMNNNVSRQDANTSNTSIIQGVDTKNLSEVDIDLYEINQSSIDVIISTYLDNNTLESSDGIPHLETVVEDADGGDDDDGGDNDGDDNDGSGDDDDDHHDDDRLINSSMSNVNISEGNTSSDCCANDESIVTTVRLSIGTNSSDVEVQQMDMKSYGDDDDQGSKDDFHQIMTEVHKEAVIHNNKILVGALPSPNSSFSSSSSSPPLETSSSSSPVDLHIIDAKEILDVQQDVVVKDEAKEPSHWASYSWVFMGGFMSALVITGLCYLIARNRRTSTYRLRETFSI